MLPTNLVIFTFFLTIHGLTLTTSDDEELFNDFRVKYQKSYQPGTLEYRTRFRIFQQTLLRLRRLVGDADYLNHGVSEFADMTQDEFKKMYFNLPRRPSSPIHNEINPEVIKTTFDFEGLPLRVDWREKGIISNVRSQGKCGACWAYSTVEVVESMAALNVGLDVTPLSVQQVMDCATENHMKGTHGCDGGDTCSTLKWMKESKIIIEPDINYPTRHDLGIGSCQKGHIIRHGVQVVNFTCQNMAGQEEQMVRMLATHGPLVVAVDATTWQDYLGGVIKYHCETGRNHAVQVVGYDLTTPTPYYIVKNTWGPDFGDHGFIYIAIGRNLCGIAEEVSSVVVKGWP